MPKVKKCIHVSGSVTGNFHCCWTISKFSSLNCAVGKVTKSMRFQLQPFPPRWYISLYPGGESQFPYGLISCYLNRSLEDDDRREYPVLMKVNSFNFLNNYGKILWNYSTETFTASVGCSHIMKRDALIEKLVGDCLTITVNVTYCNTCVMNGTDPEYLAAPAPNAKFVQDFESLLTDAESTDYVLSVGDQKIPVHSLILSARSKVFKAMFRNDMKEKESHCVEISDFEKDTMDSFIQFIYTGNVKVMDIEKAFDLLRAADKYDIVDLKGYCSDYLISHLNGKNVATILINADQYKAEKVACRAIDFFLKNGWQELLFEHESLLKSRGDLLYSIIEGVEDE